MATGGGKLLIMEDDDDDERTSETATRQTHMTVTTSQPAKISSSCSGQCLIPLSQIIDTLLTVNTCVKVKKMH